MRFLAALWSSDGGRLTAMQAKEAFVSRFGDKASSFDLPSGFAITVSRSVARNSGVVISQSSATIIPYMLHTSDGEAHDITRARTMSVVDGFLAGIGRDSIGAPFVVIQLEGDTLRVSQDFIGSGRAFVFRSPELVLITNAISACIDAVGRSIDVDALISFASCGWVSGDRTFHSGFRLPAPEQTIIFTARGGRIEEKSSRAARLAFGVERDYAINHIRYSLTGLTRSIVGSSGDDIRLGLSGGRDSRLMAATFIRAQADVGFFTTDNFPAETEIAKSLLARIGLQSRHEVKTPGTVEHANRIDALASARALVAAFDGLHEPTYIGLRNGAADPYLSNAGVSISGAAGEMAHGHYYPKADAETLASMDSDAAVDHLLRRRLGGLPCATEEARRSFNSSIRSWLTREELRVSGVRLLDYFYLYERQRRWSSFSASNTVTAPMAHASFAFGSFGFSIEEIATSSVHKTLTSEILPVWRDIPYFKAAAGEQTTRPTLTREEAVEAADMVRSFAFLTPVVSLATIDKVLDEWDSIPAARRDAIIKRALWIACVAEAFG